MNLSFGSLRSDTNEDFTNSKYSSIVKKLQVRFIQVIMRHNPIDHFSPTSSICSYEPSTTTAVTPWCHALAIERFLFSILVRPGCDQGGHSSFYIFMQLSIVVSDWGSYISCSFPFGFRGQLFSVSCLHLTATYQQHIYLAISISLQTRLIINESGVIQNNSVIQLANTCHNGEKYLSLAVSPSVCDS